jgi:hypothetical protein
MAEHWCKYGRDPTPGPTDQRRSWLLLVVNKIRTDMIMIAAATDDGMMRITGKLSLRLNAH